MDTDLSAFEGHLSTFRRDLTLDLVGVGDDLLEEAKRDARSLMQSLIYDTPESPNYERSRKLYESVSGFTQATQEGVSVTLEAFGGNEGRIYGLWVEAGTGGSRVDLERIMDDARRGDSLSELVYGGTSGLRARPSVIPAIAELERSAPERLHEAERKAWG